MSLTTSFERPRGRQRHGAFPSYKMNCSVRYRSHYERMMYFLLELDRDVISYEHEPFTITASFDDGSHSSYTPDISTRCRKGKNRLYEIKGEDYVDHEHTLQQVQIGQAWSYENNHTFLLVSSADLLANQLMRNSMTLWDYRWRQLPAPLIYECRTFVASRNDGVTFGSLSDHLAAIWPSLPPSIAIYNMLFHHHLDADLTLVITHSSRLWVPFEEV